MRQRAGVCDEVEMTADALAAVGVAGELSWQPPWCGHEEQLRAVVERVFDRVVVEVLVDVFALSLGVM